MPDDSPDPWADLADDIRRTARAAETAEVWQARATQAEARVAELEREIKALTDDRGKLMGVLAAQTGETMRLRGACEAAAAMLIADMPRSALHLLEAAHA